MMNLRRILLNKLFLFTVPFFFISQGVLLTNCGHTTERKLQSAHNLEIAAWLPWWFQSSAFESAKNNVEVFDEIKPFWYELGEAGAIVPLSESTAEEYSNEAIHNFLIQNNIRVTVSITNNYNTLKTKLMLNNPHIKERHIRNIIELLKKNNFSGVEINYENMSPGDKDVFTQFIRDLSCALHKERKTLTLTLHPKSSHHPGNGGAKAQDWPELAKLADSFSIMCYDYSHKNTKPGPIAPIWWVEEVISYAVSIIPTEKICLGIPNYGYDWRKGEAKELYYEDIENLKKKYNTQVQWSEEDSVPFLKYKDKTGEEHQVWFEDKKSLLAKLDITQKYNLKGISVWTLGYDDPEMWQTIKKYCANIR